MYGRRFGRNHEYGETPCTIRRTDSEGGESKMAILKHLDSKNANYYNAVEYLTMQYDESLDHPILDENDGCRNVRTMPSPILIPPVRKMTLKIGMQIAGLPI